MTDHRSASRLRLVVAVLPAAPVLMVVIVIPMEIKRAAALMPVTRRWIILGLRTVVIIIALIVIIIRRITAIWPAITAIS